MKPIRLSAKSDQNFSLAVVSVVFLLIAALGFYFAYPNSPPEWKANALSRCIPVFTFVALVYSWLSSVETLNVDVTERRLCIQSFAFWAIPYRSRKIEFPEVVAISCSQQTGDEFGRILRVYLVLNGKRIEIMRRFRSWDFNRCLSDANNLAKTLSVPCSYESP